jgi:hypothetical protein
VIERQREREIETQRDGEIKKKEGERTYQGL